MENIFSRTELIFGADALKRLRGSRVAVFGIGGVGGYVVEGLARSGIGALDLIDHDTVSITNLNRQIVALHSTIGKYKVDVAAERVQDINPACEVRAHRIFYLPETREQFDFHDYDYVVDAIDTVTGKLALIEEARSCDVPVICSMGAGNKTDPTCFRVADLYDTSVCPLARVMRRECKKRGIDHLKVVYSTEPPISPVSNDGTMKSPSMKGVFPLPANEGSSERSLIPAPEQSREKAVPGSTAFVPSVAGLILAGEVVRDLIQQS